MKLKSERSGFLTKQLRGETAFSAFIPKPLPPDPPLEWTDEDRELEAQALLALGRLDAITDLLPDPHEFLFMYVRKEALLSSQIEGTESSFPDLLESSLPHRVLRGGTLEVSNYVMAMEHGLRRLREGFPLSLRLLREIHALLLEGVRGGELSPGEFRRSQNWVGGTHPGNARFVPPPPQEVIPAMGALEKYLHGDPVGTPTLLRAGLAHAQFESIHPFLDGNGRLGRLLITFLLCSGGILSQPLLYLSHFFKRHRQEYYDRLQDVRTHGDWEGWLRFYLTGVLDVAQQASSTAKRILAMFETHRIMIQDLGRTSPSMLKLHEFMKIRPVFDVSLVGSALELTPPTIRSAIRRLQSIGLVTEITGGSRNQVYLYEPYMGVLREGTDEPPG